MNTRNGAAAISLLADPTTEGEIIVTSWPPALPVQHVRIARPTDQLNEVVRFYREGLGLPEIGRFDGHAGYRGVLLGLPGTRYHLEFTQHDDGSPGPAPSRDNLLVLYLGDPAQAEQAAARLTALGHPRVEAENPYWTGNGAITVEDPDRWRIVLMPQPFAERSVPPPVTVEWYDGDRDALQPLFELAEDSPGSEAGGIPLRDRVWLDIELGSA
jgi:catechol 2,3-dioxygenase-like lactoylglutathione lyase family enzyme